MAVLLTRAFVDAYTDFTWEEVVRGRIAVLRCRCPSDDVGVPLDLAIVHLVPISGLPLEAQLRRLRERLVPVDLACTVVIGDFNIVSASEGRLDVRSGAVRFDDGQDDRRLVSILEDFAEISPDGYSRRQFREGELELVSRIDRVFTNLNTAALREMQVSAVFTASIFDPNLPSDHCPLLLTFRVRRGSAAAPLPSWVSSHPCYAEALNDILRRLDFAGMDAFEQLEGYTCAIRLAARTAMHEIREPVPETRCKWIAFWVAAARKCWMRGQCDKLRRAIAHVPEYRFIFFDDSDQVRMAVSEQRVAEALHGVMQAAYAEELRWDLRRVQTDEEKAAIRARASRRIASWSPKRRRILSCVVLRDDGTITHSTQEGAQALAGHWRPVFEGCTGSDPAAAARLLRHDVAFPNDLRLPTFEEFWDIARRTPTSAPGPDGVAYRFWTVSEMAMRVLFLCMRRLAEGCTPPKGFNDALVTFIPKRSLRAGERVYAASPANFRPLTLANCSQKLIAKGINFALEAAADQSAHEIQRGFIRGRSILQNVFDVEAAIETFLQYADSDPGIFLFDIAAAFPSAEHEWIFTVLRRRRAPAWLLSAVYGLYAETEVTLFFGGEVSSQRIAVRRGIKQGCPSSGSVWAILYDPVIRSLASALPSSRGRLGGFADDLAAAVRHYSDDLPILLSIFEDVFLAAGLRLNVRKTKLVYMGPTAKERVRARMLEQLGDEEVEVVSSGVYLGVLIGRAADGQLWDGVEAKIKASTRHILGLKLPLANRIKAYRVFTFSLAGYLLQVAAPSAALLRTEAAAMASVLAAPMNAFTTDILAHLQSLGARFELPALRHAGPAAAIRTYLRHEGLPGMFEAIHAARNHEDAFLVPRDDDWLRRNVLSRMRWAHSQAALLPAAIRAEARLQAALHARFRAASRDDDLQRWVGRRLETVLRGSGFPADVHLFLQRVSRLFELLPACVPIALLRVAGNAWLTSRRLGSGPQTCRFGCMAVGGDDVRHYLACPRLHAWIATRPVLPPLWHPGGALHLALCLAPSEEAHVVRSSLWVYAVYLMFNEARLRPNPFSCTDFARTARAVMRSTLTRIRDAPGWLARR